MKRACQKLLQHQFLVPTLPRGNAYGSSITLTLLLSPLALLRAGPCRAFSPSRGKRFASPCSHAPAWEQETVSVMYAFPRRSVGTRKPASSSHAGVWETCLIASRRFARHLRGRCEYIPVRFGLRHPWLRTILKRACQKLLQHQFLVPTLPRGNAYGSSITLTLLPPSGAPAGWPLPRLLPLKGGEICFSLFPCSGVGTRKYIPVRYGVRYPCGRHPLQVSAKNLLPVAMQEYGRPVSGCLGARMADRKRTGTYL